MSDVVIAWPTSIRGAMRVSAKLVELLRDLENPRPSVEVRSSHDGRTVAAAARKLFIMEYAAPGGGMMFMRTEVGEAQLILAEAL